MDVVDVIVHCMMLYSPTRQLAPYGIRPPIVMHAKKWHITIINDEKYDSGIIDRYRISHKTRKFNVNRFFT
jgi:hypothetical protein